MEGSGRVRRVDARVWTACRGGGEEKRRERDETRESPPARDNESIRDKRADKRPSQERQNSRKGQTMVRQAEKRGKEEKRTERTEKNQTARQGVFFISHSFPAAGESCKQENRGSLGSQDTQTNKQTNKERKKKNEDAFDLSRGPWHVGRLASCRLASCRVSWVGLVSEMVVRMRRRMERGRKKGEVRRRKKAKRKKEKGKKKTSRPRARTASKGTKGFFFLFLSVAPQNAFRVRCSSCCFLFRFPGPGTSRWLSGEW